MTALKTNRRQLFAAGLGTALAGGLATDACAVGSGRLAKGSGLDLTDARDRLRAFMLMRGALDDRLVVGCLSGRYYGVVGDVVRPLFGVVSATFARFKPDGAGGYLGASYEVPFFTDLATGKVMDRWTNPYTEETIDIPHSAFPPARLAISPALHLTLASAPQGLQMDHHLLPALTIGGDVWMTEETFSTFTIPGVPAPVRYTEFVTLHATRADLEARGAKRVACQTSFEAIVSWRPWMKMGDRPGHLNAIGSGGYGVAIADLPPPLLDGIRTRRPEVLADPAGPLKSLFEM